MTIQKDLGDWIDIDYRSHPKPQEPNSGETHSHSGSESANAPYDTCHVKQGSLTFGALNKSKDGQYAPH